MSNAITIQDQPSQAAAMIQMAVDKGMTAEQLREFIAARREWEDDEARKLYSQAIGAVSYTHLTLPTKRIV